MLKIFMRGRMRIWFSNGVNKQCFFRSMLQFRFVSLVKCFVSRNTKYTKQSFAWKNQFRETRNFAKKGAFFREIRNSFRMKFSRILYFVNPKWDGLRHTEAYKKKKPFCSIYIFFCQQPDQGARPGFQKWRQNLFSWVGCERYNADSKISFLFFIIFLLDFSIIKYNTIFYDTINFLKNTDQSERQS